MKIPQDEWFSISLMGTKIGHAHITTNRSTFKNQPVMRVRSDIVMAVQRTGTGVQFHAVREMFLDEKLQPIYFISTSNETGQEKKIEGFYRNGEIELRTTLANQTTIDRKTVPKNTIFDQVIGLYILRNGLKIGQKHSLNVFSLDTMSPIKAEVEIVKTEMIDHLGENRSAFVVRQRFPILGGIEMTEWIGEDGTTFRIETDMMGMKMIMTQTTMDQAVTGIGTLDVILSTKIFARGTPPQPNAKSMKVKLDLSQGEIEKAVMQNGRQKLDLTEKPNSAELDIVVESIDFSQIAKLPITDENVQNYLRSSVYIQADHVAIRQKAKKIIGDERNSLIAVQKLNRWVYENVHDKNLETGFASALQTLETLSGDCTEHTVLMIALARSIGIPARICAGLVFQRDAFYYHFWAEVYVGEWLAIDPTLGQDQADARHIQLAGSEMESDSMVEFGEGIFRTLNQLSIEF